MFLLVAIWGLRVRLSQHCVILQYGNVLETLSLLSLAIEKLRRKWDQVRPTVQFDTEATQSVYDLDNRLQGPRVIT